MESKIKHLLIVQAQLRVKELVPIELREAVQKNKQWI